jgi:hypothetical protein
MIALIAGIAVLAILLLWAPWSGPKIAKCTPFNRGVLDNVCSDSTEYGSHHASCTFDNAPLPIVKEHQPADDQSAEQMKTGPCLSAAVVR